MGNGIGHLHAFLVTASLLHQHGDEFGRPFSVSNDRLTQLDGHLLHGVKKLQAQTRLELRDGPMLRLACRHHHKGVVGRGVSIDRDSIERGIGQSLGQVLHAFRGNTRIGRHETQHGGHVGLDHASPFGDACDAHALPAQHQLTARRFGHGVGGHDACGCIAPAALPHLVQGLGQMVNDFLMGQGLHDHPGRKGKHLLRGDVQQPGQGNASRCRSHQTLLPSARIGVARVDQERTDAVSRLQVGLTQLNRCRTKPVLGEHSTHRCARLQDRQVFSGGFLDPRL